MLTILYHTRACTLKPPMAACPHACHAMFPPHSLDPRHRDWWWSSCRPETQGLVVALVYLVGDWGLVVALVYLVVTILFQHFYFMPDWLGGEFGGGARGNSGVVLGVVVLGEVVLGKRILPSIAAVPLLMAYSAHTTIVIPKPRGCFPSLLVPHPPGPFCRKLILPSIATLPLLMVYSGHTTIAIQKPLRPLLAGLASKEVAVWDLGV
ncbi:unnamed protein product [Closterium sp. NIES-65]|nr:unnamed protein product [Closterium sp. NIES-65]